MLLEALNINKSFGQNHVLRDVSFNAKSGAALGLLGRNGSGKTTTIRIIMDLFPADSGGVTIDGKPSKQFLNRIGYLPEERGLYPKRLICEQMAYIGELRGMKPVTARERSLMLLKKLGAEDYYRQKLMTLSKGNQQKIQLAIALLNDPEIVILDEPFSGLDPVNATLLKNLVAEITREGRLVFFSSHQMSYVEEFCDDICILNEGRIVLSGNLKQIKRSYPRNRVLLAPEDGDDAKLAEQIRGIADLDGIFVSVEVGGGATPGSSGYSLHTEGSSLQNEGSSPYHSEGSSTNRPEGGGCIVTLRHESDKSALFGAIAANNIAIDSFSVIEPTLTEIFVEKAGDDIYEEF